MFFVARIETVQNGIAAFNSLSLNFLMVRQTALNAVFSTWSVSDDQGWSIVAFSFFEGFQRLSPVRAHRNGSDIDMAVSHRDLTEVFLRGALAAGCELRDRCRLRRLGSLSAGVGVNFGIQNQDVNVQVVRQDMIQSAVADIISPAVAADDPDRLADQVAFVVQQFLDRFVSGSLDTSNDFVFDFTLCITVVACRQIFLESRLQFRFNGIQVVFHQRQDTGFLEVLR